MKGEWLRAESPILCGGDPPIPLCDKQLRCFDENLTKEPKKSGKTGG
jgi:hypothetical protein